jgi:hypothetical protein
MNGQDSTTSRYIPTSFVVLLTSVSKKVLVPIDLLYQPLHELITVLSRAEPGLITKIGPRIGRDPKNLSNGMNVVTIN